MADKGKRMIFEDEYQYLKDLKENHSDPSAEWGGGSGGDTIQAGEGIVITTESDDTKTISVDTEDVAMVNSLSTVAFSGDYDDLTDKPDLSHMVNDNDYTRPFVYGVKQDPNDIPSPGIVLFSRDGTQYASNVTLGEGDDPVLVNLSALSGDYNALSNKPTIPDAVSGTNDGTNWTSLTIGSDTYGIPAGGSGGGSFDEKDFSLGKIIGSCLWTNIPTINSEPLYLGKLPFGISKTAVADFVNLSSSNTNDSHLDFYSITSAGYTETCTLPDNTQVTAYGYITNLYGNLRIYVYTDVADTYNSEFWDTGNTYFWIQYWGTSQLTFNGEVAVRLTSLKAYKQIYGIPGRVYHHVVKFTAVDSNSNNITGNIHLDTPRNVNLTIESVLKTELCNYMPDNSNIIVQGYLSNGQPILLASTVSAAYSPYGITISYYDSATSTVITGLISSFSNLTDTVV